MHKQLWFVPWIKGNLTFSFLFCIILIVVTPVCWRSSQIKGTFYYKIVSLLQHESNFEALAPTKSLFQFVHGHVKI